ncbi:M48 family metallopeptidase [Demequina oxidasica]|uniref:M48 family metallopeptidase n=1 Tax=Demequina oxidasica TaxID=676199 RepID=UPI000783CF13|nr:SprT family zinc-dependent metalloprotease [Demequina oxidasica]
MSTDLTASGSRDVFEGAGADAAGLDGVDSGVMPEYILTRKRMKHLRMTVKAPHGTVHVSAPVRARQRDIDAFVMSRRDWILKQQKVAVEMPVPLTAGPEAERLRRDMRESVPPLMEYWADRMGLEMPTLTLRRMTSRWGTCNSVKRHVTLNLELGRRDPELLEYVIVHELAHLYEPNHSKRFYAVMDKYLPDWQEKRRELNRR